MSKHIQELAKEWGVQPKDVVAAAEQLGMKGKRPQSAISDDEVERLRHALGLSGRPSQATVGAERVVVDRLVTQRELGIERLVTAREQTTETRLQANVIRRRTAREVVKREELPGMSDGDAIGEIPPGLDFDDAIPPPLDVPPPPFEEIPSLDVPPAASESESQLVAPPAPTVAPPVIASPPESPLASPPVAGKPPVAPGRSGPMIVVRAGAAGSSALPPASAPPPPGFEEMRGPKVLGRIDLRKLVPPAGATAGRPVSPGGAAAPGVAARTDAAPKKKGRKVIQKDDLAVMMERDFSGRGKRPMKKRAQPGKEVRKTEVTTPRASKRVIRISEVISVGDLAKAIGVKSGEIMKKLIDMGVMATINQMLDHDTAVLVAGEFDYQVENVAFDVEQTLEAEEEGPVGELVTRAPVVTIMGHVDHGKTSLLDSIRATDVAAGEAGGITQHIGAYTVDVDGRMVTFLDTPGHEAFTAMRARGAQVTDLVVLVVAADDGIMPQTVEAINHSRAAAVPIIVAVNKIDKAGANTERVKQELGNYGLAPEDWGGDTIVVPVSAKSKEGIPHLLEMVLLQADLLDLKASPGRNAKGTIIEARLDRGRGPVATVLVQEGTLHVGDPFVCGTQYGRIRAMVDDKGKRIDKAGPAMPVEILGLGGVPEAGDVFVSLQDDQKARQVAEHRRGKQREAEMAKTAKVSLDDLYNQIQSGDVKELKVVLKADVQGSVGAIADALRRLSTADVRLNVIHGSVGGITESDVLLATASNAIVLGFNVRPEPKAAALAEREGVDVRLYTIIYEALNEVREALEGLLEPTLHEKILGRIEVRQVFTISGIGPIAGCYVTDGKILRGSKARLLRDNIVVHDGKVGSLRRFKEDVREVAAGYECGASLDNYQDVKAGDIIEAYEVEQVARRLAPSGKGAQSAERSA